MKRRRVAGPEDRIRVRIHGGPDLPTLIYLPGIHGDWTLVEPFRHVVDGRVRFVELTYPRTLVWSLDDYAREIEDTLLNEEIRTGWLLGESFGSQIVWPLLTRDRFRAQGVVLAGGFARHPWPAGARLAAWIIKTVPLPWQRRTMRCAISLSRRFSSKPRDAKRHLLRFVARRNEPDRDAMVHRLLMVAGNDPREMAATCDVPVHLLSGLIDPIVFWWPVQRWFRAHCPTWRSRKVVWLADHDVLCSAPEASSKYVLRCMGITAR